jgi:hypothetical protein
MVTYTSFAWWQKSVQSTATTELQRLACLITTGALKSASTIALEDLLDLLSLPDKVKMEAAHS